MTGWFVLRYWVGNSQTTYVVRSTTAYEVMRKFTEWMPKDVSPYRIEIEKASHADWLENARAIAEHQRRDLSDALTLASKSAPTSES